MNRPSWDEYWLQYAHHAATRSTCSRRQVGAVIVNREQQVVSTGYNGGPRGFPHCTEGGCPRALRAASGEEVPTGVQYDDCIAIHAEANAIMQSSPSERWGSSLYTTDFPCFGCAKLIANSGIELVISGGGEHSVVDQVWEFLRANGISVGMLAAP